MAATQDFQINQLEDTKVLFTLTKVTNPDLPYNPSTNPYIPIDLTNSLVEMMIRPTYDSGQVLLKSTNAAPDNRFVITDATGGKMKWVVTKDDIPTVNQGEELDTVYDIYVTDAANLTTRMLQGNIVISRAVTR